MSLQNSPKKVALPGDLPLIFGILFEVFGHFNCGHDAQKNELLYRSVLDRHC